MDRRNEDIRNDRSLYRLNELNDYKVAGDDPDVRGWSIVDRDNQEFGVIQELIVDPEREKVRYLDVIPGASGSDRKEEDHLLIPIGVARIDNDRGRVQVSDIDKEMLTSYPTHRGTTISRDYEYLVVERFNAPDSDETRRDRNIDQSRAEDTDFYNNQFYDEDRFYTNRNRSL